MSTAIRMEGMRVALAGRVVLDVPRLVIETGERVAIVGPNGAGKSMLLKVIGAGVPARHGQVHVLGYSLGPDPSEGEGTHRALAPDARRALRRDTGLLMQGLHLVQRLSARENVLIGALARLHGVHALRSWARWYPTDLVAEADAMLTALGLADRVGTRADRLSGGERQKVALARMLLQRPRLILADEPTSALDPTATREVCAALVGAAADRDRTLVTVVHDLDLLPALSTRVIGIRAGCIAWDLPTGRVTPQRLQALYGQPPVQADGPEVDPPAAPNAGWQA